MPKHITRLLLLLVGLGIGAYGAKLFFTDDSFYRYGHYRGDAVAEIASDKPIHMGSEYCESCHRERYAEWSQGVHHSASIGKVVQCEVCHGVAGGRDVGGTFQHVSTGTDHPASGKLTVPQDTRQLCPLCHEKLAGRPAAQAQIVVATHAGSAQCTTCHNPHSPKLMKTAATGTSGGDGKGAVCAGCHGAEGVSANAIWPNLAGQHGAYLLAALKAYKSGVRTDPMMSATAKSLSDADMKELADHFARLKPGVPGDTVSAAAAGGKDKSAACAGCHGDSGISADPAWPKLAGQQKDYLVGALKAYRDGTRKSDVMAGMAKGLDDADVEALASYYASIRSQ